MSERPEFQRTLSTAIPAIVVPNPTGPTTVSEEDAKARVAALEREAKAMGQVPGAALLFHEIGVLWETTLKHPRNAAVAYQNAYKLAPKFLANIRAARRLFADVGNWVMVVNLIDAEWKVTDNPRAKASLLLEKGSVLEHRLSNDTDAVKVYTQCLDAESPDVTLLSRLEAIFTERSDFASMVKVQKLLARALTDDQARAHYLTSAGLLLEDRLGDEASAADAFRAAFALDRKNPLLLSAMKRVAAREQTVDEELAALAAEAEFQGEFAAPTFVQISKAYERLGRATDARAALLAARRVDPKDPLVLSELARLHESQGEHEALAAILTDWLTTVSDDAEYTSLSLRLASLLEGPLKRDDEALACYRAILERVPGCGPALAGIGKLHHRASNWTGLVDIFEAEAAASEDSKQRAARLYKAAEVTETKLDKLDDAVTFYQRALEAAPGYLPAQKALERIFEKNQRWSDLIAMYEVDIAQTEDRDQKVATLTKIATIYEDRLNDLSGAIRCAQTVCELAPDSIQAVRSLSRLLERAERWADVIDVHDKEASLTGDAKQVLSLAHRNAEIFDERLGDRAAATTAYERVLTLSPAYLPALKALGRLYAQSEAWDSLGKMYRAEAEIAPSMEHAAALLQKVGELYETKLSSPDESIAAYREVLTLSPAHFPALRALARIYRSQGDWESLIEVLRAEAANRKNDSERANLLYQAATLWDEQLQNKEQAIAGYQEAVALLPDHAASLQRLEWLLADREDVSALVATLEQQSQATPALMRVAANLKLGHIFVNRINDPERSQRHLEAALELEPANIAGLRMLERVAANDRPKAANIRLRLADAVSDPRLSAALTLSALDTATLDDEALAAVSKRLIDAYSEDPSDEGLGHMLEAVLLKAGDGEGLVELYNQRAAQATDGADKLQWLLRVADTYEFRLGDWDRAVVAYDAALSLSPTLFPALQGLGRVHQKRGDVTRAREALLRLSDGARDVATANEGFLQVARMLRESGDSDGAVAIYRKVLDRDPVNPVAGAALEEILAAKGGSPDLAALHERRAEVKLGLKDTAGAAEEFFAAARVHLDQLRNRPRGIELVERALQTLPTHSKSLELKGDLAVQNGNFAEAVAAYTVRIQQGGHARDLALVHFKIGVLFHDELSDTAQATTHLEALLQMEPEHTDALERLAALHAQSREWDLAVPLLKRLLAKDQPSTSRAKHASLLAEALEELGQGADAALLLQSVLEWLPGDTKVLDRLVALYEKLGDLPSLVALLESQVRTTTDVRLGLKLRLRIGDIWAKSLNDPQKAISAYRGVIEADPHHVPALTALADLYTRDTASSGMAIDTHRALLRAEPGRLESLHSLYRLWSAAKQTDKAFAAAGLLTFLKAANEAEATWYADCRSRIPNEIVGQLGAGDLDALVHPSAKSPLLGILRALGDQLEKIFPPQFELMSISPRSDRIKPDHPVYKMIRSLTHTMGGAEFEVYLGKRGTVSLEATEPISVCINQALVQKHSVREQRFFFGRAALAVMNKSAVMRRLSASEAADLLGNAVRIHHPAFAVLGRRNDDASKQLRKVASRKSLKLLEEPSAQVATQTTFDVEAFVEGISLSEDRAGLLFSGDIASAFTLQYRDDTASGASPTDPTDTLRGALSGRRDLKELFVYALSDDFFRLRLKIGLAFA